MKLNVFKCHKCKKHSTTVKTGTSLRSASLMMFCIVCGCFRIFNKSNDPFALECASVVSANDGTLRQVADEMAELLKYFSASCHADSPTHNTLAKYAALKKER